MKYWGISLDDLVEKVYEHPSDAEGGHYLAFKAATKEEALDRFAAWFRRLVEQDAYEASSYGRPIEDEEDE